MARLLFRNLSKQARSPAFSYNVYGEIDRIFYPTGGEEHFTHGLAASVDPVNPVTPYIEANRGVAQRDVYENGSASPYTWTYSSASVSPGLRVTINAPDGTHTERDLLTATPCTGCADGDWGFGTVLAGMAVEERGYSSSNQLLTKKVASWAKTEATVSGGNKTAERHPRVTAEESIVYDPATSASLSATTKMYYDSDLSALDNPVNVNSVEQYGFAANSTGTLGSLQKIIQTAYSTDSGLLALNLKSLPTSVQVTASDGVTVVSRSEILYDESGRTPGARGNPTSARVWDSTKGAVTNSSAYIATHVKFDSYGNQYESTDAMGNTTATTFDSTYHTFPVTVTSAVPAQGSYTAYGSTSAFATTATFDPTTGLPLTTTDANGLQVRIEYDPVTLRPLNTKTYFNNTQVGGTTETIYHDEANNSWVKAKTQIDDTHYDETTTYFDGLGRAHKTESLDSGGNIFVEKEFDAHGRVSRVSNPFRATETKQWTTNVYDTASRVIEVDLPDGSKVLTGYALATTGSAIGVTKLITDQAGKKRMGYSDAAGNMIRVIEDPAGTPLTTDYTFDTLGNLRKTAQGSQNRYFMHDSLGRLLYARQVEQDANANFSGSSFADPITSNNQWSVKYVYDDNGNITTTTDARNKSVTATYDHFNRIINRDYSDSTMPDVSFYYDGKYLDGSDTAQTATGSVKGKTTGIKSSVSRTNYTSFDIFGRLLTHQQITDGQTYATSYSYNLTGALIDETYPSGRVVKNTVDQDGNLSQVQSRKNSSAGYWTYADAISRDTSGNVTKMQLGNGLWETASYNDRQQVKQIGLGRTDSTQDLLKLEYAYDSTTTSHDNNGSMREQKITVPAVGINSTFTATQTYGYDALNRIASAEEKVGGTTTWKQTFTIDRYGNRNFNTSTGMTTTLGSCSTAVCNPAFDTTLNNNRFSTTQGYSYDATGSITQNAVGERFGYDQENHQTEYFEASNNGSIADASYVYDGEGRRVKKVSSLETTIFVYDASGRSIAEYSTQLATTPQVAYLTQDHLGSPRITTNENGAVKNRKDFMAYGDQAISAQRVSGTNGNNYEAVDSREDYTGYEKDSESQLEFAQARYYNPSHGRYTSIDPMAASATIKNPQTFNRYSYVLNSPYKFTDPLGLVAQGSRSDGSCPPSSASCEGGESQSAGESEYEGRLRNTFDVTAANHAIASGHPEIAESFCGSNPNIQCSYEVTSVRFLSDDITPAQRKQVSLAVINAFIDRVFGAGSITGSGKKVKSPALSLISDLKSYSASTYDVAYEFATEMAVIEHDDELGGGRIVPRTDPEEDATLHSGVVAMIHSGDTFTAQRKNSTSVGTFRYEERSLRTVAHFIFAIAIESAYKDVAARNDQWERNQTEHSRQLQRAPIVGE